MGALCESLACVYQVVVELTEIKTGELVVVTGPRPIGLMELMLAKARRERVRILGSSADWVCRTPGRDAVFDVQADELATIVADLASGLQCRRRVGVLGSSCWCC